MVRRLGLATALWLAPTGHGSVHGFVRRATSDQPIAGALIEVVGTDRRTWSDLAGGYRLDTLACDPCRLRISAPRYDSAAVEVSFESETDVQLDVALQEEPTQLDRVAVVADSARLSFETALAASTQRYDHEAIETSTPGGDPDPLRILAQSGEVNALPDLATSLHVRGGGSSDNLVLFDGIPVYSPYHGGGTLSAIAPEVVGAAVLDDNVPSVRYGGGLASTIELESRQPVSNLSAEGGLSTTAVRQSIMGQWPAGVGGFVAAARESATPMRIHTDDGSAHGFADAAGALTFHTPVGELELVGFGSRDHVGFDANVHDERSAASATSLENAFAWSAATAGAIWSARIADSVHLAARAWYSDAVSELAWTAAGTPLHVTSGLHAIGTSADASWSLPWVHWLAGVSAERLATAYSVGPTNLAAGPVVAAVYAEGDWALGRRWSVITGLRQELVSGVGSMFDPRAAVRYAISPALAISGGFSRTDQVLQSLRNEESIIHLVLPAPLPVAAEPGVPIAHADQWTGSFEAVVAPHTRIVIDGYTRSVAGLVTVPAATSEPFVLDRWRNGTAYASGLTFGVERRLERLSLSAAYSLEAVGRRADTTAFAPTSASPRSFIASAGYRIGGGTTVSAALWAAGARSTSLIADPFDWTSYAPVAGAADLAGTPERISGPVDSRRLPPYSRLDIGVSHIWRAPVGPRDARLETRLAVTNVLNATNVAGFVQPPGGAQGRFVLLPRSLAFGLAWAY